MKGSHVVTRGWQQWRITFIFMLYLDLIIREGKISATPFFTFHESHLQLRSKRLGKVFLRIINSSLWAVYHYENVVKSRSSVSLYKMSHNLLTLVYNIELQ